MYQQVKGPSGFAMFLGGPSGAPQPVKQVGQPPIDIGDVGSDLHAASKKP
jgi:hypothetical protein